MGDGWIKLHRKFIEWGWYKDSKMVHLFLHFILLANHKDKNWMGFDVKRGELVTGIDKLSKDTRISIQSIRTCIKKMESTKEIVKKSTNRFTIIKVVNYNTYNPLNIDTNKQLTNKQQTTNKQLTTNKKDKNVKKVKNIKDIVKIPPLIEMVVMYFQERGYNKIEADRFFDFYTSKGWFVGKNKMKDWKAAVRNWLRGKIQSKVNLKDQDWTELGVGGTPIKKEAKGND